MDIEALIADPEPLIAGASALAAAAGVVGLAWPWLWPDDLGKRLARVADERERIRLRERARLLDGNERDTDLRFDRPGRFVGTVVARLGLDDSTEDGRIVRRLKMAGYRSRSVAVTYVALRMLGVAAMVGLTLIYLLAVLRLDQPITVSLMIAGLAGALGYVGPAIYLKNRIDKRQAEIRRSWPDALDLMLICIEAGMPIEAALRKVAEEIGVESPVLAEELSLTTAELSYLQDRRRAFQGLGERTGVDAVRGVITALVQAEKYGTPLSRALRVLAQESRDMRMAEAEKKAAALPPKLTVPMILFFLPVLFAVIITPAAIQILNT